MRKGSRLRSWLVPTVRQIRTPPPSIILLPCTTCTTGNAAGRQSEDMRLRRHGDM